MDGREIAVVFAKDRRKTADEMRPRGGGGRDSRDRRGGGRDRERRDSRDRYASSFLLFDSVLEISLTWLCTFAFVLIVHRSRSRDRGDRGRGGRDGGRDDRRSVRQKLVLLTLT